MYLHACEAELFSLKVPDFYFELPNWRAKEGCLDSHNLCLKSWLFWLHRYFWSAFRESSMTYKVAY